MPDSFVADSFAPDNDSFQPDSFTPDKPKLDSFVPDIVKKAIPAAIEPFEKAADVSQKILSPETANKLPIPITGLTAEEIYRNTKASVTHPIEEYKRRESEYAALTPEQKRQKLIDMTMGVAFGQAGARASMPKVGEYGARVGPKTSGATIADILASKKPTAAYYKMVVESQGAQYVGIQKFPEQEDLILFNEPDSHSTLALKASQFNPESVKERLATYKQDIAPRMPGSKAEPAHSAPIAPPGVQIPPETPKQAYIPKIRPLSTYNKDINTIESILNTGDVSGNMQRNLRGYTGFANGIGSPKNTILSAINKYKQGISLTQTEESALRGAIDSKRAFDLEGAMEARLAQQKERVLPEWVTEKNPEIQSATIKIGDNLYEGVDHGEAIANAKAAGEDISKVNRERDGLFKTSDGRLITRDEAQEEFGIRHSAQVPNLRAYQQTPVERLTSEVSKLSTPKQNFVDKINVGERVAASFDRIKDAVSDGISRLKGTFAGWVDAYKNPPEMTDYRTAKGNYLGARQINGIRTMRLVKSIQDKFPNKLRQEAITNYIQAEGNESVLSQRAMNSADPKLKAGYEAALKLTPEEKLFAQDIGIFHADKLDEAIKAGILEDGIDNYIRQAWKKESPYTKGMQAENNAGMLQTNPSFLKKRIFDSYFDGEQKGAIPIDKRAGYLVSAYNRAFDEAIAARAYIKSLFEGKAQDGRPLVSVSGAGSPVPRGGTAEAYIIKPRVLSKDTGEYKYIDHPSLRKWKWVASDDKGKPIILQGDVYVHPEIFKDMKNMLGRSAIQDIPILKNVLALSQDLKGIIMSFSGFHQFQTGEHAVFHKVNPFRPEEINLRDPVTVQLVNHGLKVYDHDGMAGMSEGLSSSGLINKLPGVGEYLQKYTNYLFQDYIPRVKVLMGKEAYARNLKRYASKLTEDQIATITANQSNAAFGEQNYAMMGRSKTFQDILRLTLLAPDFLEARARFVGQALKPYGREQGAALARGAIGIYAGCRILNTAISGNPHWDTPFGVVIDGREYGTRTVFGDLYHLFADTRSYVYHRINPATTKLIVESLTGRDEYGRKRDAEQTITDYVKTFHPIPTQGFFSPAEEPKMKKMLDAIFNSLGGTVYPYKTSAQKDINEKYFSHIPEAAFSKEAQAKAAPKRELLKEKDSPNFKADALAKLKSGAITLQTYKELLNPKYKNQEVNRFRKLGPEEQEKVMMEATAEESKILWPEYAHKWQIGYKKAPAQDKPEMLKSFRKVKSYVISQQNR